MLVTTTPVFAQDATPVADSAPQGTAPLLPAEIVKERVIPDRGRNIIIQQLRPPDRTAVPNVTRVPLTAEEIAAKRARYEPSEWLWLTATVHPGGMTYVEWWSPHGGGQRFAAWSNADCRLFSAVGEFHLENDRTRYLAITVVRPARSEVPDSIQPSIPVIPADSPGFILVKGDPANSRAINPIAALHQIYKTEAPQLRDRLEEIERKRLEDKAWQEAHPVVPRDAVIRFWPKKSRRHATESSVPPANE